MAAPAPAAVNLPWPAHECSDARCSPYTPTAHGRCVHLVSYQPVDDGKRIELRLNVKALEDLLPKFKLPLHVWSLTGHMGFGKSKLASVIVSLMQSQKPTAGAGTAFVSAAGGGFGGVTAGVWMWSEPLPHPSGTGSILLLDCEGMGDSNPDLCSWLFLFCLLMSSAFCFVCKNGRISNDMSQNLELALQQAEHLQLPVSALPTLALLATDMTEFKLLPGQPAVSAEQWIDGALSVPPKDSVAYNKLTVSLREELARRMKHIKDNVKKRVAYLVPNPAPSLVGSVADDPRFDMWTAVRSNDAKVVEYTTAVRALVAGLAARPCKMLPGGTNVPVGHQELIGLMKDIVVALNNPKNSPVGTPLSVLELFLRKRLQTNTDRAAAGYNSSLSKWMLTFTKGIKEVEDDAEKATHNGSLTAKKKELATVADKALVDDAFKMAENADANNKTLEQRIALLPRWAKLELDELRDKMRTHDKTADDTLAARRSALQVAKHKKDEAAAKAAEEEAKRKADAAEVEAARSVLLTQALVRRDAYQVRIDGDCPSCHCPHSTHVIHSHPNCPSASTQRAGQWFWVDRNTREVVCDLCWPAHKNSATITLGDPLNVICTQTGKPIRASALL